MDGKAVLRIAYCNKKVQIMSFDEKTQNLLKNTPLNQSCFFPIKSASEFKFMLNFKFFGLQRLPQRLAAITRCNAI